MNKKDLLERLEITKVNKLKSHLIINYLINLEHSFRGVKTIIT